MTSDLGGFLRRSEELHDDRTDAVDMNGVMRTATIVRAVRCMSVSVGTTLLSASILVVLALGFGMPAGTANAIAVASGIVPSYAGNRYWVWERRGRNDLRGEVVPFWSLSLAGLVISSWLVARVGALTRGWPTGLRVFALPIAMLSVFGALWTVQFVVLDRVVFRRSRSSRPTA